MYLHKILTLKEVHLILDTKRQDVAWQQQQQQRQKQQQQNQQDQAYTSRQCKPTTIERGTTNQESDSIISAICNTLKEDIHPEIFTPYVKYIHLQSPLTKTK